MNPRPFTLELLPEAAAGGPVRRTREALLDFVGAYLLDFEQAAEAEGLTLAQARVLGFAMKGLAMREIAYQFGCDPSNITSKVDKLVLMGLVERRPDEADARVKRIVATAAGADKALKLCERRVWLSGVLGALDAEEFAAVERALGLLNRATAEHPDEAGPV